MPAPGRYSLTLYRGDSAYWDFVLWNDVIGGDPYDLTNATVKAQIRDIPAGKRVTPLELTIELPNTVHAKLSAQAAETVPVKGVWDLQVTFYNGDTATLLAGDVAVTQDVTDSGAPIAMPGVAQAAE
jgi:hypothetical protein